MTNVISFQLSSSAVYTFFRLFQFWILTTQPLFLPFPYQRSPSHSDFDRARIQLSHLTFSPLPFAWFLMHPFTVLVFGSTVCFFSSFPDSLPQLFLRCLLPTNVVHIFRFTSVFFRPLLFNFRLLSLLFLPFRSTAFASQRLSQHSYLLSLLRFPRYLLPDSSCIPSRFSYSAFWWFPFILPCFAPAAVPQVIPFDCSLGLMHDFRNFHHFRFSTQLLSLCFFRSDYWFSLTVAYSVYVSAFAFTHSPFFPAWFLMHSFLVFILGSLFVSFRPSLFHSHSCSTSACLLIRPFPFFFTLSFVRFFFRFWLLSFLFLPFHLFPDLPHSGFPSARLSLRIIVFPYLLDLISHVLDLGFCTWLLLVSFRSSLIRSRNCSSGDSLWLLIRAHAWLPQFSSLPF